MSQVLVPSKSDQAVKPAAAAGRLPANLKATFINHHLQVEAWFREQWQLTPAPLFASVDLRNSGYKVAPVDTNLFPAGFNNLNPNLHALCVQALRSSMLQMFPGAKNILLIPENHTRNQRYFDSLAVINKLFVQAGFSVRLGSVDPAVTATREVVSLSGDRLLIEPVLRDGDCCRLADFDPCVLVLNHDLSGELPAVLRDLQQPVVPMVEMGWGQRLKSVHFACYQRVAYEFAEMLGIDPWLVTPGFSAVRDVNFLQRLGCEQLVSEAERLLTAVSDTYQQYGVTDEPYLVVKSDSGTYGMGVMSIKDAATLATLNRKQRTKMSASKGGVKLNRVIIQEGVYTNETYGPDAAVAEPVVYGIGGNVVGGFYRVHNNRGPNENLNAPGMDFIPLAFEETCQFPSLLPMGAQGEYYVYGVVARLAMLAAAREVAGVLATKK